jgi:NAD(P)-dependent dehydrogenase (short-subunit alcohol dehydrogenase family)
MSNNIEGKVVVIKGASSRLGEATARLLSVQDASVVLGARRVDRIQSLADELTRSGGKALAVATDVTQCDQVQRLIDPAVKISGQAASRKTSPSWTQARTSTTNSMTRTAPSTAATPQASPATS